MQFSSSLLRSPGKGEQRSVKAVCVYVCVYVCVREPVSNPLNHCRVSSMRVCVCVCAMSPGRLVLACSTTVWIRGEAFGVALCFNLELMTEPPALLAILPLLPNTYSVYLLAPPCTPPFTCSANPHNLTQNAHCLPPTLSLFYSLFRSFCPSSLSLAFHILPQSAWYFCLHLWLPHRIE